MYYILAKEIVQKCIEHGILQKVNGCIPIYEKASDSDPERYPEGWVLYPEEDVIYMIMHDEAGQSALQEALLEKGISMLSLVANVQNVKEQIYPNKPQ